MILEVVGVMMAVALAAFLLLGRGRFGGGRMGRLANVWRLAARLSASRAGAWVRRLISRRKHHARIDEARRKADAARVTEAMGNMKGALMKLGQMASFISDDIPVEMRVALAQLQSAAPAMDVDIVRDAIARELGKPIERAFARFDDTPLASASIGQVHRARLPDGREVAVKVQYPGVADAVRADLANVGVLYRMVGLMFPTLETGPVVEEMRARFGEELDYAREAANQTRFAELYAGHPFIHVPEVVASHSTARVITTELAHGERFTDVLAAPQEVRDRVGEIIYRFAFNSIFRHGVFNGDPHPGNYLFVDDGPITFLDFGCVKYFPAQMLADWKALVRAHLRGQKDAFRENLVKLRFIPPDSEVPLEQLYGYWGEFYRPFRDAASFQFTRAYASSTLGLVFRPSGPFEGIDKKVNMPPDFVLANRIQWGIYSILGQLEARANFHGILLEMLDDGPPASPLGEAEAAWRHARAA